MVLPLATDNKALAIVQLFVPPQGAAVFRQEQTLLSTLAAHSATCLSNVIHFRQLEVKARLEGELEAARNIQQSLTPHDTPSIPHVNIAGAYLPAHEVGGDYLDYFQCGDGSWAVIVADVCGKGLPAAMLMTILRSVARVEARTNCTAKSLLCAINQSICCNINERSFITALCLVIKPDGTAMTYSRAGHAKLIKIDAAGQAIASIESAGVALGIIADAGDFSQTMEEIALPLSDGDAYLAYTDGVSEANNAAQEFYGYPRLVSSLQRLMTASPDAIVAGILEELRAFMGKEPAHDDSPYSPCACRCSGPAQVFPAAGRRRFSPIFRPSWFSAMSCSHIYIRKNFVSEGKTYVLEWAPLDIALVAVPPFAAY